MCISLVTTAFIAVWIAAQALQSKAEPRLVGQNAGDDSTICSENKLDWIKNMKKLYPDKVCDKVIQVFSCTGALRSCYCDKSVRLQDCSDPDKDQIYTQGRPDSTLIRFAKYFETEFKCSGYCNKCKGTYYYSDSSNK